MKRTRHPIFKEIDFDDADDQIVEQTSNAIPDFTDHMFGLAKEKKDDDDADE